MKRYSSWLAFFGPFALFVLTACPSVSFFDSGEMISSSYTLGIAHPPGYPIYVLVSHAFRYLPIGNAAFRVVLFSAVFGSLCCYMAYRIARTVLADRDGDGMLSLAASLTLAASFTLWSQSVVAEVYCLSTFLITTVIYLALRYESDGDRRMLYAACFVFGVAFCAHYTALALFPILLFVVWRRERHLLTDFPVIVLGLSLFLCGVSALLYLPFRAWQYKALVWGDPQSLSQLLWVLLRKGYQMEGPERTLSLFAKQMASFNLYREFGLVALFVIVFGFFTNFRRVFVLSVVTLIILVVMNIGVVVYGNPVEENIFLLESFHTPGYLLLAVFAACAAAEIAELAGKIKTSRTVASAIFAAGVFASLLIVNYRSNDWSQYRISYDYGRNVLKSCDRNGILFTWGDSGAFPLWYLQMVENYRRDVVLLHCPHLDAYWYWMDKVDLVDKTRLYSMWETSPGPENMVRFLIRDFSGRRPIHFDYSTKYSIQLPGLLFNPDGLVYTFTDKPGIGKVDVFEHVVMRGMKDFDELKDLDTEKAQSIYAFCYFDAGVSLVMQNDPRGRMLLRKAVDILPSLMPQVVATVGPI